MSIQCGLCLCFWFDGEFRVPSELSLMNRWQWPRRRCQGCWRPFWIANCVSPDHLLAMFLYSQGFEGLFRVRWILVQIVAWFRNIWTPLGPRKQFSARNGLFTARAMLYKGFARTTAVFTNAKGCRSALLCFSRRAAEANVMHSTGASVIVTRADTILSQPVRLKHVADGMLPRISPSAAHLLQSLCWRSFNGLKAYWGPMLSVQDTLRAISRKDRQAGVACTWNHMNDGPAISVNYFCSKRLWLSTRSTR